MDDARGLGIWLKFNPETGSPEVVMDEGTWTALAALGFIGAVVAGLITAWLVLP